MRKRQGVGGLCWLLGRPMGKGVRRGGGEEGPVGVVLIMGGNGGGVVSQGGVNASWENTRIAPGAKKFNWAWCNKGRPGEG